MFGVSSVDGTTEALGLGEVTGVPRRDGLLLRDAMGVPERDGFGFTVNALGLSKGGTEISEGVLSARNPAGVMPQYRRISLYSCAGSLAHDLILLDTFSRSDDL